MANGITVDLKEFNQALVAYAAASKKEFAEVCNRQCRNLAIQGVKNSRVANKGAITSLKNETDLVWWLAWRIKRKSPDIKKKDAKAIAVKQLRKRQSAVSFVKAFFVSMSKAVAGTASGKSFAGMVPYFNKATDSNASAEAGVKYDYKKRKGETAKRTETILNVALQKGIRSTIADMEKYIERKLGLLNQKHGAK